MVPPGFGEVAAEVEEAVHAAAVKGSGVDTGRYKKLIASRVSNLKSGNNPKLKEHLVSGELAPAVFATMTPNEMRGEAIEKLVHEARAKAEAASQMGQSNFTVGMSVCPMCKDDDIEIGELVRGDEAEAPASGKASAKADDRFGSSVQVRQLTCRSCGYTWTDMPDAPTPAGMDL